MSSPGRQRLARGVWTSCCGSDQSEDRGHHRPGCQHCWGPAGNTHLILHLHAHSSISTGWQSILICVSVCVCVFVWLGGKLWRWRTVRTSLWLWAGKSLPVSWSSQDNVACHAFKISSGRSAHGHPSDVHEILRHANVNTSVCYACTLTWSQIPKEIDLTTSSNFSICPGLCFWLTAMHWLTVYSCFFLERWARRV